MRRQTNRGAKAFTLIELLVVMAIIVILAGLVVATTGYVQEKGKRSRAEAEIAAISAALESYKADNGIYPDLPTIDPRTDFQTAGYEISSRDLYAALSGDSNYNRKIEASETGKSYFNFKPNMLSPSDQNANVIAIRDPFGNSYGYSTINQSTPNKGYNPTFDLWSTGGKEGGNASDLAKWIKNW